MRQQERVLWWGVYWIVSLILFFFPLVSLSKSVGSDTAVSRQTSHIVFSLDEADNAITGFAWAEKGFTIGNETITVTFDATFPVTGGMTLNGGKLVLGANFDLTSQGTLGMFGSIEGNGYFFSLHSSSSWLAFSSYNDYMHDLSIGLHSDLLVSGKTTLKGTCAIIGKGGILELDDSADLIIDSGSQLTLRDLEIKNVSGSNIRCSDDSSSLILDNVTWVQDGDFTFSHGSITFNNKVDFSGSYTFFYQSGMTSTVADKSQWHIGNSMQLSIGRKEAVNFREPLYLASGDAALSFANATLLITASGMQLQSGKVICDRDVTVDIDSTSTNNGLILGDGVATDMVFQINPGATVIFPKGHLVFNVPVATSVKSYSKTAKFHRKAGTFNMQQDATIENFSVESGLTVQTIIDAGKTLRYLDSTLILPGVDFDLTGIIVNSTTLQLDANDIIFLIRGIMPLAVLVVNTGNKIHGTGGISGPIILQSSAADLTFDLNGTMLNTITLGSGKLILSSDLQLIGDKTFLGTGTVNLADSKLVLGGKDQNWTSTIYWEDGTIDLHAKVSLSSTWTFSGTCHINGNGHTLDLDTFGNLVVERGSTLVLNDIRFEDVSGMQIRCLDDAGLIVLDNVFWIQDGDFTFDKGKFLFKDFVDCSGSYTFAYQSSQTSIIEEKSEWYIRNGMQLSIGRQIPGGNEPIVLKDGSSLLRFSNATFKLGANGIQISHGKIQCKNDVTVDIGSTDTTNGLILGDGVSTDLIFQIDPGATVIFPRGHLVYNISSPTSIKSKSKTAKLLRTGGTFYAQQNVRFENMSVSADAAALTVVESGKTLEYVQSTILSSNALDAEFDLSGIIYSPTTLLLNGNHSIFLSRGVLPLATLVNNAGNKIHGTGNVSGPIIMQSSAAELTLDLNGYIQSDITLGGGKLILGNDLILGGGVVLAGSGTVDLGSNECYGGVKDLNWTGSIYWDGANGEVSFGAKVSLSSTWTFSGTCVLDGRRHPLVLGQTGNIVVERGSTLTIRDIRLEGMSGTNVRCLDNAGSIIFEKVRMLQTGDYAFTKGSFEVVDKLKISGAYTFSYQTVLTSTIKSESFMRLNEGVRFSYCPSGTDARNLIEMADNSSCLVLNGATLHSTVTGLQLTRGILEIHDTCFIESDATIPHEGIAFGDGILAANDLYLDVFPESKIKLKSGYVRLRDAP